MYFGPNSKRPNPIDEHLIWFNQKGIGKATCPGAKRLGFSPWKKFVGDYGIMDKSWSKTIDACRALHSRKLGLGIVDKRLLEG